MKNSCRKQAKTHLEFDHDFEAKMVPTIVENQAEADTGGHGRALLFAAECGDLR